MVPTFKILFNALLLLVTCKCNIFYEKDAIVGINLGYYSPDGTITVSYPTTGQFISTAIKLIMIEHGFINGLIPASFTGGFPDQVATGIGYWDSNREKDESLVSLYESTNNLSLIILSELVTNKTKELIDETDLQVVMFTFSPFCGVINQISLNSTYCNRSTVYKNMEWITANTNVMKHYFNYTSDMMNKYNDSTEVIMSTYISIFCNKSATECQNFTQRFDSIWQSTFITLFCGWIGPSNVDSGVSGAAACMS